MDYANLFSKIIAQAIVFMQDLLRKYAADLDSGQDICEDKENIEHLLQISQDFMGILDAKKSAEYKVAIMVEFFENILSMLPMINNEDYVTLKADIHALFEYIDEIKSNKSAQDDLMLAASSRLQTSYDFTAIDPQIVTFWLKSICTIDVLRKMQTLLLYLPKSMHQGILKQDKNLHNEKVLQLLIQFLTA